MTSVTTGLLSGFGVVGAIADTAGHAGRDSNNRAQMAVFVVKTFNLQ